MAEENPYATAANFGGHEDTGPKRPWVKEVIVPDSIKRKYPSKHYVYKVIVKWTNGAETVIYRRYSLFFDFVVKLQDLVTKLRQENPRLEDTDLQLPELPSKVLFGRSQTHQVAEKRRRKVEDFCQQLVLLPPEISESSLVLGFFNIWPDDTLLRDHSPGPEHVISAPVLVSNRSASPTPLLQSSNSKSSIASTPSDNVTTPIATPTTPPSQDKEVVVPSISLAVSSDPMDSVISHPDDMEHLEQYRVLGNYERKDSHQVDLYTGQTVHVIEKHDTGWWMVMSEDEQGYAPAAYLESMDGSTMDKDIHPQNHTNEVYEAMEAYIPVSDDEVGFKARDKIQVIAKSMDGWWKIRCNGQSGFAPAALIRRTTTDGLTQSANSANIRGFESERTIYEELNIHHPPPRRNTLDRSVVNHIAPGYLSPRSHPELAGFVEENIYCDPAEESSEDEEHIYKVPRLCSLSEVPKENGVHQPIRQTSLKDSDIGTSRSGSASSAVSQDGARRGSANSQRSVGSPNPVSPALQSSTVSSSVEREQLLEESIDQSQTVYENLEDALVQSQELSNTYSPPPAVQTKPVEHASGNSAKKPTVAAKPPPPTKPKPVKEDVYECMDSESSNQTITSTPNHSGSIKGRPPSGGHSVDDYEDLDAIGELQTPLLPAMDDYVDMGGELSKSTPIKSAAPPPPPRVPKGSPSRSKPSLSKSYSIDPMPPVFGEDEYIDMGLSEETKPPIKDKPFPLTSPPPRGSPNKPKSARPVPPPPYSQSDKSPRMKSALVRAKSMEDLLSSSKDSPNMPRQHSPPFSRRNADGAPPLPSRNPPSDRPTVENNYLPTKPKAGKSRAAIKGRKPMLHSAQSAAEFKWPESSNPPPLPKSRPGRPALPDRSLSPPNRHSISPPGIRETSPHPPLMHTVSEPNANTDQKSTFVAIFSFSAPSDGCVSFKAGDKCEKLRQAKDSGWWLVKVGDKVGWAPGDYWKEQTRERSVTNAYSPNVPPPIVRKPRSHTVAEINTSLELSSSIENSLQSSQGSFSLSSSLEGEVSPLSESGRHPVPVTKGKGPPPKPKPIPDAGSPITPRKKAFDKPAKPLPPPPPKYNSTSNTSRGGGSPTEQRRGSGNHSPTPPPLPPANATRRLGSQSSQEILSNGGVTSPNRLGPPHTDLQDDEEYVMLEDAVSIESSLWFVGKMERLQAEHFLMDHGRQREFLVRERTTKDGYYALSVRYHYNIRHFNIDPTPDGQYSMGTLVFPTINEIITHYQQNSLFIHDNQHVVLGQAVKRRGRVADTPSKHNGV